MFGIYYEIFVVWAQPLLSMPLRSYRATPNISNYLTDDIQVKIVNRQYTQIAGADRVHLSWQIDGSVATANRLNNLVTDERTDKRFVESQDRQTDE